MWQNLCNGYGILGMAQLVYFGGSAVLILSSITYTRLKTAIKRS
jgi:hypothetical protein